jgi:hypothetical protein
MRFFCSINWINFFLISYLLFMGQFFIEVKNTAADELTQIAQNTSSLRDHFLKQARAVSNNKRIAGKKILKTRRI